MVFYTTMKTAIIIQSIGRFGWIWKTPSKNIWKPLLFILSQKRAHIHINTHTLTQYIYIYKNNNVLGGPRVYRLINS